MPRVITPLHPHPRRLPTGTDARLRNDSCMWSVGTAKGLANQWVSPMGVRWRHLSSVGRLAECLDAHRRNLSPPVIQAAWVHDVGYAPELVETGLHALDGARALQRFGAPEGVVALVAHHTGAAFEAEERGLRDALEELPSPDAFDLDALTLLDLVVGPSGELTTPKRRIDEILSRYGTDDPVHRAVTRSRAALLASAERARARLGLPDEWPLDGTQGVSET